MTQSHESTQRVAETGGLLRDLLIQRRPYRSRWLVRSRRPVAPNEISYAAVSEVISAYLLRLSPDGEVPGPRALKDRVRRALDGAVLQPQTLRCFTHAFDMDPLDRDRLVRAYHGLVPLGGAWPPEWRAVPLGRHRTLSLNEIHDIGRDRAPVRHRTVQVIRAEVDGYDMYPFFFDTPHASVLADDGGVAGPVYPVAPGLWGANIALSRPLAAGQTATLMFECQFNYGSPPAPEFRRGARQRVANVGLSVRFDPSQLPARLYWATWDLDQRRRDREPVDLVGRGAHRFVDAIEGEIAGFAWEW